MNRGKEGRKARQGEGGKEGRKEGRGRNQEVPLPGQYKLQISPFTGVL